MTGFITLVVILVILAELWLLRRAQAHGQQVRERSIELLDKLVEMAVYDPEEERITWLDLRRRQ